MTTLRWWIGALALFAVILFASGIALTLTGVPFGAGGALAVHEASKFPLFVALIGSIIVAYVVDRSHGPSPLEWTLYALAILFVAVAAFTGQPVVEGSASAWGLWAHRVTPWLGGVLAAIGLYLRAKDLQATERSRRERVSGPPRPVTR